MPLQHQNIRQEKRNHQIRDLLFPGTNNKAKQQNQINPDSESN